MWHIKPVLPVIICLLSTTLIFAQSPTRKFSRHAETLFTLANNAGPGYGVQGEYFLNGRRVAFVLSAASCYGQKQRSSIDGKDLHPMMIIAETGFRYYPATVDGDVRFSFGGYLLAGMGKGLAANVNYLQRRTVLGLLAGPGVHFRVMPNIRLSTELCLGIGGDNGANSRDLSPFLGQVLLGIGYRW